MRENKLIRTIAGVNFEAVKTPNVRNNGHHWEAKVVQTGYTFPGGVFDDSSRVKLWASIEDMARRRGLEQFKKESLSAS